MLYQLADNNLEYYIRQDYAELSISPVLKSPDLRTWIYYDALNQGGAALPNTYTATGVEATATLGSRYITYDASQDQMRIDLELQGEQNSDTPTVMTDFLKRAMQDCIENGHDSLMAVFSSHGGGFAGFGGDENVRRNRFLRRELLQTNQNIATAIKTALDEVPGAPDRLDVLGFDACLMQGVGVADDYMDITQYILASEAVEPGHGESTKILALLPLLILVRCTQWRSYNDSICKCL